GRRYQIIQASEVYDMCAAKRRRPRGLNGYSGIARPQDVDQSRGQSRVVSRGEPLVVLQIRKQRRLAGELRSAVVLVVLQNSSPEDRMFPTRCYVVIHPGRVSVPGKMNRRVEAEALRVQSVPPRIIVGDRVLLENRHHSGIGTDMLGIQRFLRVDVERDNLAR